MIPDWVLDKSTIDFDWNPNFAFTSWFNTVQSVRFPVVTAITQFFDVTILLDKEINDVIYNSVQQGYKYRTKSWYAAPPFQIVAQALATTYQLNLGYDSLNKLVWCFNSNEHTKNTVCKEIYYLSMNLTQYQIKVLYDVYPQDFVQGAAGTNFGTVNNTEFSIQTYDAFDKLVGNLDTIVYTRRMAGLNFRECMPSQATTTGGNLDPYVTTNYQLGHFFETRLDGGGPYAFSFEGLSTNGYCLCGIDTRAARPFDIIFNTSISTWQYPGNSIFHAFCQYDMLVIWDGNQLTQRGKS